MLVVVFSDNSVDGGWCTRGQDGQVCVMNEDSGLQVGKHRTQQSSLGTCNIWGLTRVPTLRASHPQSGLYPRLADESNRRVVDSYGEYLARCATEDQAGRPCLRIGCTPSEPTLFSTYEVRRLFVRDGLKC